ncbi:LppX_LprAFG lipoprotein [Mycobacteroides abscessus]|uniref:LppX_LprAFG lipoprotein n=1 Tax=Mycobacteroides abscessus TaxID=36809 RepID=UPI000C26546C|nr:LppX_LprAFG lipoprotein [Mycobacteroides abscessus]
MTITLTRLAAVGLSAAVALLAVGCQQQGPSEHTATSAYVSATADAETDLDVTQLMSAAIATARAMRSAHLMFSSTGVRDLLAKAYAADVTLTPAVAARGNATLKINGDYIQAQFQTVEADLWIQGAGGTFVNAGPAQGTLNPAALLDPQHGIASVLAAVTFPVIVDAKAHAGPDEAVKVAGTLSAAAASALVPRSSLGDATEFPVAVWLAPVDPYPLLQVIVTVGEGSLTLRADKAEPFTVAVP